MDIREAVKELEQELSKALRDNKIYTVMCLRTEIEKLQSQLKEQELGKKVVEIITELENRNFIYSINRGFGGHSVCVGVDEVEYEGSTLEEALVKMADAEFNRE
jgi:GTP-binding protein EngB required for normal cell division